MYRTHVREDLRPRRPRPPRVERRRTTVGRPRSQGDLPCAAIRHALDDRERALRRRRPGRGLADRANQPPGRQRDQAGPEARAAVGPTRAGPGAGGLLYDRSVALALAFLGPSGSAPTARRAPSALLVRRGGDRLMFDCGEGTQRQLLQSSVGLVDLTEIYLTHYHLDHWLGLPGMLKTFVLRDRQAPLTVYGPPGLEALFDQLRRVIGRLTYPFELVELRGGDAPEPAGDRGRVVAVA